ncbi:uncharacterized protein LOC115627341 [Scaptodrosophila lebanonensis]|uniref:Uncharacterized protein LOC115627341 n=1 Tax=Drosophila lebanonensis TaxID=7225 RepID=A0A6J2TQA2_DROLE|nr:uncharacterized protein LOC115627341 [Scaptodrosophila lebanonensis]
MNGNWFSLLWTLVLAAFLAPSSYGQVVYPGIRVRQIPVLSNGQIQTVQFLDTATPVTPQMVQQQLRQARQQYQQQLQQLQRTPMEKIRKADVF